MLLDYHSLYEQPVPAPAPPWVPQPRVKGPQRVRREREPEPEPVRQVVVGTVDLGLPMLRVEIAARASVIPPTPITDIDLDAQDDGWTDERLLMAVALFLLEEEDDDSLV